jgi:2-dehydropantoate 2-reductase
VRYIIYGAGGVGGIIGGKMFMSGAEVVLVARGEHLMAIQRDGLKLQHPKPDTTETLGMQAVANPADIEFRPDDVVVLTMKSQDTVGALEDLRLAAGDQVPVVCCQNGVENERQALRRFANVYSMLVIMPANYLEPGIVETTAWPVSGVLDIGRYPHGSDALAESISRDLAGAGFVSRTDPRVMRLKYAKLAQNMVNALQAILGPGVDSQDLLAKARAEADACFDAAGIDSATLDEFLTRNREMGSGVAGIGGGGWRGGSTWQSLVRGSGSSETDYLNGEVVLLGRLHGIPTPANEVLQLYVDSMAKNRQQPGDVSIEEVRQQVALREAAVVRRD